MLARTKTLVFPPRVRVAGWIGDRKQAGHDVCTHDMGAAVSIIHLSIFSHVDVTGLAANETALITIIFAQHLMANP